MPLNLLDPATWQASTLLTAEGPIRYWVLADWEAYYEQYEDVNNLTRVLIAVAWEDALLFKEYALGFAERVGTSTYFQRYTPLACAYQDSQYLTSLKKVKIHAGVDAPSGLPVYHLPLVLGTADGWPFLPPTSGLPPRIVYDATFTIPPFDILDQSAFEASAGRRELLRYVTREQQVNPRERKVPSYAFETYNPAALAAAGTVIPEVGFTPFYSTELYYTWRKIPVDWVPGVAIAKCLNRINSAVFDYAPDGSYGRFLKGVLLFKGLANRITPYRGPNAEWLVDLPYVFDYQPGDNVEDTWNRVPRNDGTWAPIRVRDSGTGLPGAPALQKLYLSEDFEKLFQPGP